MQMKLSTFTNNLREMLPFISSWVNKIFWAVLIVRLFDDDDDLNLNSPVGYTYLLSLSAGYSSFSSPALVYVVVGKYILSLAVAGYGVIHSDCLSIRLWDLFDS